MIPVSYIMVDLGGIDLADVKDNVYPGLYNKIYSSLNACQEVVLCNWFVAGILIPPTYCAIDISVSGVISLNDIIFIYSDDTIQIPTMGTTPVIEQLSANANGTYEVSGDVDGFNPVVVNVSPSLVQLTATENNTYSPPQGYDGFSTVNVIVPPEKTSDNLVVNWDFSNPINTRGQTSYSGDNTPAIDGWVTFRSEMRIVTGGIVVKKTGSSGGYLIQRTKAGNVSYYSGKQMTISAIIDGELYSGTFSVPTSQGGSSGIGIPGECTIRIYRHGSGVIEITIDASPMDSQEHVVSAYKLEFGSNQTLATRVNGGWVLNQDMNTDNEKLKQYILL